MLLKNIASVLASTLLAFLVSALLSRFKIASNYTPLGIVFLALLFGILNAVYQFNRQSKSFSQLLIFGISVKLLISFFTVLLYALLNHGDFYGFALNFVANYFLFTIFEVLYLIQLIKNNTKASLTSL